MPGIDLETLSDEDFLEAAENEPAIGEVVDEVADEDTEEEVDSIEETDENTDDVEDPDTESDEDDADDDEDTQDDDHSDNDDEESDGDQEEDSDDQADEATDTPDGEKDTEDATGEIDYETGYKELFEPFMANGKEMKVDSVDDARKLMQMGAGFHKRMAQLKPYLKIINSLKNNDLLDTGKINELIDISKKNPNAIAKLVKDAGIDPLDINTKDGAEEYKPNNYEVSDSTFNLDQAIDAIKDNESYSKSIKVMGEQWDKESRDIIAENPEVVGIIDEHIQSGVFDVVQDFVEKEQTLGRMSGLSDIEAYRAAATKLKEDGILNKDGQKPSSIDDDSKKEKPNPLEVEAKKKQEAKRKKRRKAAAPNKGKSKAKKAEEDYSDLSDEDFLKAIG